MRALAFMLCFLFATSVYAQKSGNSSFIPLTPADIAVLQQKAAEGQQSAKDILAQYNTHQEQKAAAQQAKADSLAALKEKAAQGDAVAENALGEAYSEGRGVLQSYAEAQKWYAKAAAQGNKEAVHNLKRMRRDEYLDHRAKVLAEGRRALEEQQRAAQEAAANAAEDAQRQAAADRRHLENTLHLAAQAQEQSAPVAQQTAPTPALQSWVGFSTRSGSTLTPDQTNQLNMAKQFAASKGH